MGSRTDADALREASLEGLDVLRGGVDVADVAAGGAHLLVHLPLWRRRRRKESSSAGACAQSFRRTERSAGGTDAVMGCCVACCDGRRTLVLGREAPTLYPIFPQLRDELRAPEPIVAHLRHSRCALYQPGARNGGCGCLARARSAKTSKMTSPKICRRIVRRDIRRDIRQAGYRGATSAPP